MFRLEVLKVFLDVWSSRVDRFLMDLRSLVASWRSCLSLTLRLATLGGEMSGGQNGWEFLGEAMVAWLLATVFHIAKAPKPMKHQSFGQLKTLKTLIFGDKNLCFSHIFTVWGGHC